LSFSFTNYLSETLWTLPTWTLPLLMLDLLGAEANAYFFVAWTISILVLATLNASATSLFAEGSNVEGSLGSYLGKSLKFTVLLFLPAMVILIAFGDKLLLLFGGEYSTEGKELLWILAVGMLPASMNYLYLSAIRVEKKLKDIILMSISVALGTLILSYILIPHLGIYGAGVGWLTTHALIALVVVPKLLRRLKAPSSISSTIGQMVGED
jgi:O-antigen/teichoic acid export membrane protein